MVPRAGVWALPGVTALAQTHLHLPSVFVWGPVTDTALGCRGASGPEGTSWRKHPQAELEALGGLGHGGARRQGLQELHGGSRRRERSRVEHSAGPPAGTGEGAGEVLGPRDRRALWPQAHPAPLSHARHLKEGESCKEQTSR